MIEITRSLRVLAGGLAAGAIGVTALAGGTAWAEPARPAPPAPGTVAPAPQNTPAAPAQGSTRVLASPPAANPFATPPAATPDGAVAAPTPAAATPAASGTIREYLQAKGVKLEAQKPQGFNALNITLPMPPRWTQVPDPNVPDAFAVIADRQGNSVYSSNAQLVVYKLIGDFDSKEAITHGYIDSQKLPIWQTTNASMADLGGFPSSVIEGTYRDGDVTLNTSRRNVIAAAGHDAYLVSLSVTTDRAVAVGDSPATEGIITGFQVAAPGAPVPVPAAPIAQTPAAPASTTQTPPVAAVAAPAPAAAAAPAPVATAPTAPAAPAAPAAPVRLPAQPAQANQPLVAPTPNILAMVPGLPPLPNFSFLQH